MCPTGAVARVAHGHLCVVFQYPFSGLGLGGGNRLDVVGIAAVVAGGRQW